MKSLPLLLQTPILVGTPIPYPHQVATPIAYPEPESALVVTVSKEVSTPNPAGISTLSPDEIATDDQYLREMSLITLESNGQIVTIGLERRFFVFLDDEKYPIKSLTCEPECLFGYISNSSFRGPDFYPIYFEPTRLGKCTLRNGDFSVTIIVLEPTPKSLTATPLPTYAPAYP